MRYGKGHKAQTRTRILRVAGRRFREKGYRGAGVDDVMREAGLTAGGFYAHFVSKQALLGEVLAHSLQETRHRLLVGLEGMRGAAWLREIARRYLSRAHRDEAAEGCALPSLSAELARMGEGDRRTFETHLRDLLSEVEGRMPGTPALSPRDRALATLSLFAGSLMLSRAVADRALSDRILLASRRLAMAGLEDPVPLEEKNP